MSTLGCVETLCILGGNVKSLLALVRKEFTNCFPVLMPITLVIFATLNGAIVYSFLCTIHFAFTYVRWWHEFHKVYCTRAKLRVYIFVQTTKLPSDDYMHDKAGCMLLMTAESWFYSWLCVRSYTFGRNYLCLLLTTNYNALITQNTKELCLEFPLQIPGYISMHCSTLIQSCSVHW